MQEEAPDGRAVEDMEGRSRAIPFMSDTAGWRVAELRRARGINREDFAATCTDMGWPMSAASLTNIESGRKQSGRRRREISLDELVVLARALRVPPVLLLFPLGVEDGAHIGLGDVTDTWHAFRWFVGEERFGRGSAEGDPAAAPITFFRRHQDLLDELDRLQRFRAVVDYTTSTPEGPVQSSALPGFSLREWPPEYRVQVENTLAALVEVRTAMRRADLKVLPELPESLAGLEG